MEEDKRFTVCRLCVCPSEMLIGVFELKDGYTPADMITELLHFEVSMGDIYPQCVCGVCMGKLTDFKTFKELCSIYKASIDRAYAAKYTGASETTPYPVNPVPCKIEKILPLWDGNKSTRASCKDVHNILTAEGAEVIIPDVPKEIPMNLQNSRVVSQEISCSKDLQINKSDVHPTTLKVESEDNSDEETEEDGRANQRPKQVRAKTPNVPETHSNMDISMGVSSKLLQASAEPKPSATLAPSEKCSAEGSEKAEERADGEDGRMEEDGRGDDHMISSGSTSGLDISQDEKMKVTTPVDHPGTRNDADSKTLARPLCSSDISLVKNAKGMTTLVPEATPRGADVSADTTGNADASTASTSTDTTKTSRLQPWDDSENAKRARRITRSMMAAPFPQDKKMNNSTSCTDSHDDSNDEMEDFHFSEDDNSSDNFSPDTTNSDTSDSSSEDEFKHPVSKKIQVQISQRDTPSTSGTSNAARMARSSLVKFTPKEERGVIKEIEEKPAAVSSGRLEGPHLLPPPSPMPMPIEGKGSKDPSPKDIQDAIDYARSYEICQASLKRCPNPKALKCALKPPPPSWLKLNLSKKPGEEKGPGEEKKASPNSLLVGLSGVKRATTPNRPGEVTSEISTQGTGGAVPKKVKTILLGKQFQKFPEGLAGGKKPPTNHAFLTGGKANKEKPSNPEPELKSKDTNVLSESDVAKVLLQSSERISAEKPIIAASCASEATVIGNSSSTALMEVAANPQSSMGNKNEAKGSDISGNKDEDSSSSTSDSDSDCLSDKSDDDIWEKEMDPSGIKDYFLDSDPSLAIKGTKNFECPLCGKRYSDKRKLGYHMDEHEFGKRFKCDTCGKRFGNMHGLKHHLVVHVVSRNSVCDICGKGFKNNVHLKTHMKIHGEKTFVCDVCGKKFSRMLCLKSHQQWHNKEKTHACEYCGKLFRHVKLLASHLLIHSGKKVARHACKECDGKYHSPAALRSHIMSIHSGERPYKCSLCDKDFPLKSYLDRHMNTHTREFQFKCDMCEGVFSSAGSLYRHRKRHSGGKDYKCNVCGKAYTQSHNLKNHKKKHLLN